LQRFLDARLTTGTTWELDKLSYAGQEHLDATYVAGYDQKSPTDWSEDVAGLQALGIGASSTVVDLGARTGRFAEAIAAHVRRVVAVDVSEWLDSAPTDPARGWTSAELAEHIRTEHSTFTWLLEPMLERAGFEVRQRVPERRRHLWRLHLRSRLKATDLRVQQRRLRQCSGMSPDATP
jgi:hypothetical protein